MLEQTPTAAMAVIIAATAYPCCAGVLVGVFTLSKVTGNVFGYASGNAKRRSWGAYGYLGLLPVVGLAVLATLRMAGIDSDTAAAYVADTSTAAYEKAQPYAQAAVAKASPYVSAAMDKASPYVDAAAEKAAPYVAQASAALKPYFDVVAAKFS